MKKNIAGVMFTETGIMIEKNFQDNPKLKRMYSEEVFKGDFLELAKRIVKARMAHCRQQLHIHLASATHIQPGMIAWEGGHFNVKVWEELEKALTLDDARKLNTIQCQQIIRAILLENVGSWAYDYNMDTWTRFQNGDRRITEEFKNFISEQILVAMQPVIE